MNIQTFSPIKYQSCVVTENADATDKETFKISIINKQATNNEQPNSSQQTTINKQPSTSKIQNPKHTDNNTNCIVITRRLTFTEEELSYAPEYLISCAKQYTSMTILVIYDVWSTI